MCAAPLLGDGERDPNPNPAGCASAQLHPWFRRGMPPELDLDVYNAHYLHLSRETGDAAAAIRAVICEAVGQAPPEPAPTPEVRQSARVLVGFWASCIENARFESAAAARARARARGAPVSEGSGPLALENASFESAAAAQGRARA